MRRFDRSPPIPREQAQVNRRVPSLISAHILFLSYTSLLYESYVWNGQKIICCLKQRYPGSLIHMTLPHRHASLRLRSGIYMRI